MQSRLFLISICIFASSVNIPVLEEKQDKGMSFINKMKRSGPRIDPWGTSERTGNQSAAWPSKTTRWILLVRYDLNQDKRFPFIPKDWILWRRSLWLTESNALLKSRYIMSAWPDASNTLPIVWYISSNWVVHYLFLINPCCALERDGSTMGYIWLKIHLSIILDTQLSRGTGR